MHRDGIVILHGIFRTKRSMASMARFLEHNGYAVLNLAYPSTKHPLEELADIIHPHIDAFTQSISEKLHFVGYSMGGLLIRAYLCKYKPRHLGRVVMLGTPNRGSEVADFMKDKKLYRWLYGAAGQQLVTNQNDFVYSLGQVDYELGVIAGNRSIDPVSSYIIGKPNDGKVSIDSTKIQGMCDHIVVPATHTFFPSNKAAQRQTLTFLQKGCFQQI